MLATILAARPPPQHVLVPGARFDMGLGKAWSAPRSQFPNWNVCRSCPCPLCSETPSSSVGFQRLEESVLGAFYRVEVDEATPNTSWMC